MQMTLKTSSPRTKIRTYIRKCIRTYGRIAYVQQLKKIKISAPIGAWRCNHFRKLWQIDRPTGATDRRGDKGLQWLSVLISGDSNYQAIVLHLCCGGIIEHARRVDSCTTLPGNEECDMVYNAKAWRIMHLTSLQWHAERCLNQGLGDCLL